MDEKIINVVLKRKNLDVNNCISLLDKVFGSFENKEDYDRYIALVSNNFNSVVKEKFPLLELYNRDMKHSYIVGYNIAQENYYDIRPNELNYGNYGMFVLGYIPWRKRDDYLVCQLFDVTNTINYEYLKSKNYCHLDCLDSLPFKHICTHKEKDINRNNFIYTPVSVSLRLYLEYRYVDSGGKFRLDCYPHGGRP